jgi:UDP-GlcNAc:undecaprenyl-phosphate/decaprenyl-phosphate GlcNAc-1-phosphate transferase
MQGTLILLGAIGFSYMLNKILLRFSKNFGVDSRQSQNVIRWASTSKPTTGGFSFYLTFLVGSLALVLLRPEGMEVTNRFLALFLSGTLAFLIGFADDAYGTHPRAKFLGQMACGVILLAFGIHIEFFSLMNANLIIVDYLLTLLWVVGMMNSLNMLDNMDGVTATIATTIALSSLNMIISVEGLGLMFYVLVAIIGGFVGFLFWNWRPAKVYMGDTGSMFIGMVVAFFGIIYFWNIKATPDNISHLRIGLIPMMALIVPIMDTTFVTVARLARGSSPFVGGKDHLTHNLARLGVPEMLVPVTLGIVSVISGGLAFYAYKLIPEWQDFYGPLFALYPVALFGLFTYLYIKGTRIGKMRELLAQREEAREARQAKQAVPVPIASMKSGR